MLDVDRELLEVVDFSKLDFTQFEELCFELLQLLGYESAVWRKGPADRGRDIEGKLRIQNPLSGEYLEHWLFECKHYRKSLDVDALNSKFAWADAERPNHLAILTSSYLTNQARDWMEKIQQQKAYRIHVVEGRELRTLLAKFPKLVEKYFGDKYSNLLQRARHDWLAHGILPSAEVLFILHSKMNPLNISPENIAFLWCAGAWQAEQIELWCEEDNSSWGEPMRKPFDFDFLDPYIHALALSSGTHLEFQSLHPHFQHKRPSRETSAPKVVLSLLRRSRSSSEVISMELLCKYNSGLVVNVTVARYPEDHTKIEFIDLNLKPN